MTQHRIWELTAKKLSGEATPRELKELEDLLRNDPELHYSMQTVADIWHQASAPKDDAAEAFDRHTARMKAMGIQAIDDNNLDAVIDETFPEQKAGNKKRKLVLVMSAVIVLVAGFYLYKSVFSENNAPQIAATDKSEASTRYGSKTKLVLPDGTHVWLNSGSKLTYDKSYGNNKREVVLSGEAYFDVVRNTEKPFIIHANQVNITVLGTAFNVKSYPGDKTTETSLIRGSVEVSINNRPSEKFILKPNEKLVVLNEDVESKKPEKQAVQQQQEPLVTISHLTYQKKDSAIIETSWVENKLIFNDESFHDLAIKMERWYGISIEFHDAKIEQLRFTGIFENESIQQALKALQITAPFNYVQHDNHFTISK